MLLKCKNCASERNVKNGFAYGAQRYKCKSCGYNYIQGDKRQKYTSQDRLKVLKLYLENCGIRTIERLTGVRNSQISKWIQGAADSIKKDLSLHQQNIKSVENISILEIDELCTYIKKDQKMEGNLPSYGLLLIGTKIKLLILK